MALSSLNKVTLIGRLGRDPEVRSTASGRTVTTLSIATSETYVKDSERKEKTEWHRVILWDKLGQLAGNYLKKGRQVYIEGRLTYRDFIDRDNQKRYITEIVATNLIFLGSKDDSLSNVKTDINTDYSVEPEDIVTNELDNYVEAMQNFDDEVPF